MKIGLVQLRLLAAVAETGNVSAAARRLGLTQSGASQAIATLEKILGVAVLARKRDGAVLTAFGQSILDDAKTALDAIGRIERQARGLAGGAPVRLRIASIPSVLEHAVPGWRKTFQRLYPEVAISTFEGGHEEVSLWVRDGIADIGITSLPLDGLETTAIAREELLVVGRRDDPLMRLAALPPEALRERQLIAAAGCAAIIDSIAGKNSADMRREQVRTRDIATVLEMVRQNIGFTVLSEISIPSADMRHLRSCRFDPPAFRTVYIAARTDSPVKHLVDAFCRLAADAAAQA